MTYTVFYCFRLTIRISFFVIMVSVETNQHLVFVLKINVKRLLSDKFRFPWISFLKAQQSLPRQRVNGGGAMIKLSGLFNCL